MQLTAIHIYPIKSCAGMTLQQSELTAAGLQYDRQWMIVDQNNQFLTQRTHPQMALIETDIVDGQLTLSTFGMESHTVAAPSDSQKIETEVFGDPVKGMEQDKLTAEWLSQAIGTNCKLIRFPDDETRQCDPDVAQTGDHTKYADAMPLLLISEASLNHLNEKLTSPVGMDRFRPNLVVNDCGPHDEDHWAGITIGNISLRAVQTCARCSVPTVDPQAGVLAGPEPIHTLSSYRERDGEIFFGLLMAPEQEGVLHVGDTVLI